MTNGGARGWDETLRPIRFAGVSVINRTVTHKKVTGPLAGAVATVESAGDIERRFSATRLFASALPKLAFKKKRHPDLFVTVTGSGYRFVVPVDLDKQLEARQFVLDVNHLAEEAAVPSV